jgi:D-isomer specific 2-hydroxyacid dehydrogenase, NAD binding domain
VVAQDIRPNPAVEEMGIEYMSVDELLAVSDIISLHVPLFPSTFHLINAERWVVSLDAQRPGFSFCGRGGGHSLSKRLFYLPSTSLLRFAAMADSRWIITGTGSFLSMATN